MSAARTLFRRGGALLRSNNTSLLAGSSSSSSYSSSLFSRGDRRGQALSISHLVKSEDKSTLLFDSLAIVRKLEKAGMAINQAEGITSVIREVLSDTLEYFENSFVSLQNINKTEMSMEKNFSELKYEVKGFQELHLLLWQNRIEMLQLDLDKLKTEQQRDVTVLRSEIDKATNEMKAAIQGVRDQIVQIKYTAVKYFIGTLLSAAAVIGISIPFRRKETETGDLVEKNI